MILRIIPLCPQPTYVPPRKIILTSAQRVPHPADKVKIWLRGGRGGGGGGLVGGADQPTGTWQDGANVTSGPLGEARAGPMLGSACPLATGLPQEAALQSHWGRKSLRADQEERCTVGQARKYLRLHLAAASVLSPLHTQIYTSLAADLD